MIREQKLVYMKGMGFVSMSFISFNRVKRMGIIGSDQIEFEADINNGKFVV
jgi:hypothetical protein